MTNIVEIAWSWLMSLDATTRAAIIGGSATIVSVLGALLGVYLNLAWNRKQHRDEKSYNLRRDVYLEALGTTNRAFVSLVRDELALKDASQRQQPDPAAEFSASCAKVHLLGGKRVVQAMIEIETAYRTWARKFSARNWDSKRRVQEDLIDGIDRLRTGLRGIEAGVQALDNERGDIEKQITAFNAGAYDAAERDRLNGLVNRWEAKKRDLQANTETLAAKFEVVSRSKDQTGVDKLRGLSDTLRIAAKLQEQVDPLGSELIVAMKNDLGLRADERWYFQQMQESLRRARESMVENIDRVSSIQRLLVKLEQLNVAGLSATDGPSSNSSGHPKSE